MGPSAADLVSLGLLLAFALIMAGAITIDGQLLTMLASIATLAGVAVSLYQVYMIRRDQQISSSLAEWGHTRDLQSVTTRSKEFALNIKEDEQFFCIEELLELGKEYDALNRVIAGQPGMRILVNMREVVPMFHKTLEDPSLDVSECMDAIIKRVEVNQLELNAWTSSVLMRLRRWGILPPGVNA